MKRLSIILALCAMTVSLSNAQDEARKKTVTYLHSGINYSFFGNRIGPFGDGERYAYENFGRISPTIGFGASYWHTPLVGITWELNYALRGGAYRQANNEVFYIGGTGDEKAYYYKNYRLNYVEIPVMLAIDLRYLLTRKYDPTKLRFVLSGGLSAGFNTESSLRYNGFKAGSSSGPLVEVTESFKVKDVPNAQGLILNYVTDFAFHFQTFWNLTGFINLRYTQSLSTVYSIAEVDGYNMNTKMGTITVSCGVNLNKKRVEL